MNPTIRITPLLALLATLWLSRNAVAVERFVPQQYPTIQAAINASIAGDVVTVAPGTYVEGIVFAGKNITVRSSGGAAVTTILPTSIGRRCVTFVNGESNAAVLDGFTLRGGNPTGGTLPGHGAGILCCSSSFPTILNCIVRDGICELGAGIYSCLNSCARLGNVVFCNNLATSGYGWDIGQCYTDLGGVVVCAECGCSPGSIVQWPVSQGGNGHWYQARLQSAQLGWDAARSESIARGGDLATIESAQEQAFLQALMRPYSNAYWLGLQQDAGAAEPLGGWRWTTGTALTFANWAGGQPDNANGNQHYGAMLLSGGWSDWRVDGETFNNRVGIRGWIIEWSEDCNLDGTVDFGQIQSGQLADIDADGVPDLCETPVIDCNSNGVDDSIDLNGGSSVDCNSNGIPDDCEVDGDGDGAIDGCDGCPNDPAKTSPGICGCGVADADSDSDGTADCDDVCPSDPTNLCGATSASGTVVCWGAGLTASGSFPEYGQSAPPALTGRVVDIAAGWTHSLAIREDRSVVGWGANRNNLGAVVNQSVVPADLGACRAVSAGFYHSIAIQANGSVRCWGDNRFGQSTPPVDLGACTTVSAGGYHCAAIRADQTVRCWGAGLVNTGFLPDLGQSIVPSSLGLCVSTASGGYHTAAIRSDGTLVIWGSNQFGQATPPADLGACAAVAAGDVHTVALRTNGSVVCFGGGTTSTGVFPQFGQSIVPSELGACSGIAAGGYHTVVLKADGSIASFGAGAAPATSNDPYYGQALVPAALRGPDAGLRVAAGGRHTVVITRTRLVPSQYSTIQAAIDASSDGDTVVVAAGAYVGPIDFLGKRIVVRGAGASDTTISGASGQVSSVVRMMSNEPAGTRLEGFTIRGGITGSPVPGNPSAFAGGGLFMYRSDATVAGCIFENNRAAFGGGLYLLYSGGLIENCVIRTNQSEAFGGGGLLFDCATLVRTSTFAANTTVTAGGGLHIVQIDSSTAAPALVQCEFTGNAATQQGGGVSWYPRRNTLMLTGCSIVGNNAPQGGGGLYVYPASTFPGGLTPTLLVDTEVCGNESVNATGSFVASGKSIVCDCAGDVDSNGQIDGVDLAAVLAVWGSDGANYPSADANHDGVVNGADLGTLLSGWGTCP